MPDSSHLVAAALRLRGTAPEAWDEFLLAMRGYATAAAGEMVRCTPDLLQRAQGMAIASAEISHALNNAPTLHEKYQGQRHGRTNTGEWRNG